MDWTTIKFSELMRQKTRRMDAKYWIKKKNKKRISLQAPKRVGPPLMSQGSSRLTVYKL